MFRKKHFKDPFAKREAEKYTQPIASREYIVEVLKRFGPLSRADVLNKIHANTPVQAEALRRRLIAMVRDGQLLRLPKGLYQVVSPSDCIEGQVRGHKDGHGFVFPNDGTSKIYLAPRQMREVFDGDLVSARIVSIDKRHQREGIVTKILHRELTHVIGHFVKEGDVGFVIPGNKRITQNIIIPDIKQLEPKDGQIVVAKIDIYPNRRTQAVGHIVEIAGDDDDPALAVETAIQSHGILSDFSEEVLKEARSLGDKVSPSDLKGRADLRDLHFITIDGEDAKDFDDAVYCEPKEKGGWRLFVAIADVSHYVKPNMALDSSAKTRGNSVYFPSTVIPMLPHELSNELCSLKPNVDRLTLVCEMAINQAGTISQFKFYSAVIHSHVRTTYKKAANLISTDAPQVSSHDLPLYKLLCELHELYKALKDKRKKRGAIDFETHEVKVQFNAQKKVEKLVPVYRNDAHKLIEECMLCANVCAAKFLKEHNFPSLFRVHDGPKSDKLFNLGQFLKELGLKLGGGDLPTPKDYSRLIEKIKGRPDVEMIEVQILRSMSRAFYSPDNEGHFGLAYEEYTHFTSPIRRYPDLLVHRAISSILDKNKTKKTTQMSLEALRSLGEHCSITERRADEATRDVMSWCQCQYMRDKLGQEYKGIVSGVTSFGVFVKLPDLLVEGLVHISELRDDYYVFDAIRHQLMGQRTRRTYRFGDEVNVRVARVGLEDRQIDFQLL